MYKILLAFAVNFIFLQGMAQKSNTAKMQAMFDVIVAADIQHPEIVMAQVIQETGWMNCKNCCLQYNNYFGFMATLTKCMKFASKEDCVNYYKRWQDKRYPKWRAKTPKGTYYDFLVAIKYAVNTKYNDELKPKVAWVKKHLKNNG
jgi:hypothetical protein